MKNISITILAMLLFAGALTEIYAAGTPAGTVIQTRSRATYTTASGAQSDTVYSQYVVITVKQIASFNITPVSDARSSVSDSSFVDYPVTITNSGNGSDRGNVQSTSSRGWVTQIFFDANGDGILQAGELAAGAVTQTSVLAADVQWKGLVRVTIPRDESLVNEKDTTTVVVRSNFDNAKTNTGKYITTVLSVDVRSVTAGLTVNNPVPNAGSTIIYTLTFTNNGTNSATGVSVANLLPASLVFVSGTASQGTVNGSGNPVLWNIGTINPGGTVTITVTVTVNGTAPIGSQITNSMVVSYTSGVNNYSIGSNQVQVTVGGVLSYGVALTRYNSALTKEATDTAVYRYKVQNTGSFKDVIELSSTSSRNFSWNFFKDSNNNSILDASDAALTNTNGAGGIDVDSVAAGDSVRVFARAIIPRLTTDLAKDTLTVTGISSGDGSKTGAAVTVTTINVPVVAMSKSVFPVGSQPAGSIMTYTIAFNNTGSASVANFSVVDTTPPETDYVPNSVKVNGNPVGDNASSLSLTNDTSNNKVITVNIGTLAAQASGSVEFKVKIK